MYRTEKLFAGLVVLAVAAAAVVLVVPQVRDPARHAAVKYGVLAPASQQERRVAGERSAIDGGGGKSIHEAVQAGRLVVKGAPGQQVYTQTASGDANGPWPGTLAPSKAAASGSAGTAVGMLPLTDIDASFASAMQAETTAATAILDAQTADQLKLCKGPCIGYEATLASKSTTKGPTNTVNATTQVDTTAPSQTESDESTDDETDSSDDSSSVSTDVGG